MTFPPQSSAIAVASLDIVPVQSDSRSITKKLIGVGIVSHRFTADGEFKLRRGTATIGQWSDENRLFDWLEDALTGCELLVGNALNDTLAILRAGLNTDLHLRLAELVNAPPERRCDLSTRRWCGGRRPFVDTCHRAGVQVRRDDAIDLRGCWFLSQPQPIKDQLGNQAAAAWRLWASQQDDGGNPCVTEELRKLDDWLAACVTSAAAPDKEMHASAVAITTLEDSR